MYTTFHATDPVAPAQQKAATQTRVAKHSGGTAHACLECRRRKSRCDGGKPCTRCREGAKEHLCLYVSQKPRVIPSQKLLEELSTALQQCRTILDRLFPTTDIATLSPLSREELVSLAGAPLSSFSNDMTNEVESIDIQSVVPAQSVDVSLALEQLHPSPSEYDEESPDFITDDVNALSLSSTRQSSYVGSSSIATAFKVIAVVCPGIMKNTNLTAPSSPFNKSDRDGSLQSSNHLTREVESSFVDAYFDHVHVLIPMVNEQQFRNNFENDTMLKDDVAWLALMNMVLALGAIASETCIETNHIIFYQRAKNFLTLDSFSSGKIEIVQALGLMGGLYLHYCNRPNMAVAVIGAALRMAYALGLHRGQLSEYAKSQPPNNPYSDRETRRRTWWSLVCLDIWGSTTLGRSSMGDYFGPTILVPPPAFDDFPDYPVEAKAPALVAAVQFCQLSSRIQDRLASSTCLNLNEALAFDSQLEKQYLALPAILKSPTRCPRNLLIPRAILKWRYQNARLLLHRPTLLAAALSRKSFEVLTIQEQSSISQCRKIAAETIVDIACDWQPDPICGWHAVWHLFQASMVPLVSSFSECDNVVECGKWHGQIDMVLRLLQSMEIWSPVAKRTREVIGELYKAAMEFPKDFPGNDQLWEAQTPFMFDETAAMSMWFNASEWPTFPVESMQYVNDLNHVRNPDEPAPHGHYIGNGQQQNDYMNDDQLHNGTFESYGQTTTKGMKQ